MSDISQISVESTSYHRNDSKIVAEYKTEEASIVSSHDNRDNRSVRCGVCSGPDANHYHFGSFRTACKSCCAFFRRIVRNNNGHVGHSQSCGRKYYLDARQQSCRKCRFHKCLKIGMQSDRVMSMQQRMERAVMLDSRPFSGYNNRRTTKCGNSFDCTKIGYDTHTKPVLPSVEDENLTKRQHLHIATTSESSGSFGNNVDNHQEALEWDSTPLRISARTRCEFGTDFAPHDTLPSRSTHLYVPFISGQKPVGTVEHIQDASTASACPRVSQFSTDRHGQSTCHGEEITTYYHANTSDDDHGDMRCKFNVNDERTISFEYDRPYLYSASRENFASCPTVFDSNVSIDDNHCQRILKDGPTSHTKDLITKKEGRIVASCIKDAGDVSVPTALTSSSTAFNQRCNEESDRESSLSSDCHDEYNNIALAQDEIAAILWHDIELMNFSSETNLAHGGAIFESGRTMLDLVSAHEVLKECSEAISLMSDPPFSSHHSSVESEQKDRQGDGTFASLSSEPSTPNSLSSSPLLAGEQQFEFNSLDNLTNYASQLATKVGCEEVAIFQQTVANFNDMYYSVNYGDTLVKLAIVTSSEARMDISALVKCLSLQLKRVKVVSNSLAEFTSLPDRSQMQLLASNMHKLVILSTSVFCSKPAYEDQIQFMVGHEDRQLAMKIFSSIRPVVDPDQQGNFHITYEKITSSDTFDLANNWYDRAYEDLAIHLGRTTLVQPGLFEMLSMVILFGQDSTSAANHDVAVRQIRRSMEQKLMRYIQCRLDPTNSKILYASLMNCEQSILQMIELKKRRNLPNYLANYENLSG